MNDDTMAVIHFLSSGVARYGAACQVVRETIEYESENYRRWYTDGHGKYKEGHNNTTCYAHALSHSDYDIARYVEERMPLVQIDEIDWAKIVSFLLL